MAGTLAELRQFVAARIAASSTAGLAQGSITSPTWRQERSPFAILDSPKSRTHLAFSCQIQSADFVPAGDGSSSASPFVVEAVLAVLFLFRVRASRQADIDAAATAAEHVARSVLTLGTEDQDYMILPDLLFTPTMADDGETLMVEQRYRVRFETTIPNN
mgnify:CR=1 FL=1|tara:strand:- start:1188 stop:1667 length:480 start_codon:yes stop_codon:yes gene_type:complete